MLKRRPASGHAYLTPAFARCAALPLLRVESEGLVASFNRPEYVRWASRHAIDLHLQMVHNARLKLISTCLPRARTIVDLGGAAGSIYALGYPYKFKELVVVDLPPDDRHSIYQGLKLDDVTTPAGPIRTLLTNMTDLSAIPAGSVDLVWSGQSIEHITEDESRLVYAEVLRILRPGGHFCLDTPNRLMTSIHLKGSARWVHPDHKIEYEPEHLRRNLRAAGFEIVEALGLVEMIKTARRGFIDYRDFYAGAGINTNVDGSYLQYYRCVPARDLASVPIAPAPAPVRIGPPEGAVDPSPGFGPRLLPEGRWQRFKSVFWRS